MDDRSSRTEELRRLQAKVEDLDRRGRAALSQTARHDLTNAVGAARNALELLSENPEPEAATRFLEMAQRNIDRAAALLGAESSGGDTSRSARNERNDLGGTGERKHWETFGL
jgi:signal transduction histidine kinase